MKHGLRVERLARKEERLIIKRIVFLTVVSVILAVCIFAFGIGLLGKLADILGTIFKSNGDAKTEASQLQVPALDDLPQATNSAKLKVVGFSSNGEKAFIYVGEEKVKEVDVRDTRFEAEDIILKKGGNVIRVKAALASGRESDFSDSKTVILDSQEPKLEIETPTEGESFSGNNRIRVSGNTDRDAQVLANGFLASVNADFKFEVFVPVNEGETSLEIKAIDAAGNSKIETRKVHYKK